MEDGPSKTNKTTNKQNTKKLHTEERKEPYDAIERKKKKKEKKKEAIRRERSHKKRKKRGERH